MKQVLKSERVFLDELMKAAQQLRVSTRSLTLGEMIALIRQHLGMSQSILSRLSEVPQSSISRIEQGKIEPNLSTLHKVLKALSCDLIIVPLLKEPIDIIRRKQAHLQAEKRVNYLKGTMSLEKQEPNERVLQEILTEEEEKLLRASGKKLWKK